MELMKNYQTCLRKKLNDNKQEGHGISTNPITVGIVGGGISGLYSALLLQYYVPDVNITVFEASNRVGGRIRTHKFSDEPYQYGEAGAMRIPCAPVHEPVFRLIEYLNAADSATPVELIDFVSSCPAGNRVLVNGTKIKDGRVMTSKYADSHCSELGFPSKTGIKDTDTAGKLLISAIQPVIMALKANFEEAMTKYDKMSLHQYLINEAEWSEERISYFEVMCGVTNRTHAGLIDLAFSSVIQFDDLSTWKTIEGGMSKLPETCAKLVQKNGGKILLNSKVESVSYVHDYTSTMTVKLGFKRLSVAQSPELAYEHYDAVIMAVPSPCLRMMNEKPQWPADMKHALRSLRHHPIIKILLRFKSRFWECSNLSHPPSLGGKSITDLPSRLIIYPSYGIGSKSKGILSACICCDDAKFWLPLTKREKIQLVLEDLQALYPEVDIASEYAGGIDSSSALYFKEAYVEDWTAQWSMGLACSYFPAQLTHIYPILAQNQGSIYFAGGHLSTNPTFIVGALESTKFTVQQLIRRQINADLEIDHFKVGDSKCKKKT